MKNGYWLAVILAVALIAALAWPSPQRDDRGIGKWHIYELQDSTVVLLNTEDGKSWRAAKTDQALRWFKCDRE